MDKALYVEATAVGYYGGKRVAGSKFWLANGETEFSSKWMKKTNPLQATDPPPDSVSRDATQAQNTHHAAETERDKLEADLEPNSTHTAQAPKRAGRMRAKGGNKEKA